MEEPDKREIVLALRRISLLETISINEFKEVCLESLDPKALTALVQNNVLDNRYKKVCEECLSIMQSEEFRTSNDMHPSATKAYYLSIIEEEESKDETAILLQIYNRIRKTNEEVELSRVKMGRKRLFYKLDAQGKAIKKCSICGVWYPLDMYVSEYYATGHLKHKCAYCAGQRKKPV